MIQINSNKILKHKTRKPKIERVGIHKILNKMSENKKIEDDELAIAGAATLAASALGTTGAAGAVIGSVAAGKAGVIIASVCGGPVGWAIGGALIIGGIARTVSANKKK